MDGQSIQQRGTIDLGPTRVGLIHAFWVAATSLVLGLAFVLLGTRGGDVNPGSLIFGLVIVALALMSAVLEFRALPGAIVKIGTRQLLVQPRHGDAFALPLETVKGLKLVYNEPIKRGFGRLPQQTDGGLGPGWWLSAVPKLGATPLPGHDRDVLIGVDDQRIRELGELCRRHGLTLLVG